METFIKSLRPLDDRITLLGMSCSGKTTFAELLEHQYYCFDALFPWHEIETFGMSITKALEHVAESCVSPSFVLDGWHISDLDGQFMPDSTVYVIYSSYKNIVSQYRCAVHHYDEFLDMYKKWYGYRNCNARYFLNQKGFVETSFEQYVNFVDSNV